MDAKGWIALWGAALSTALAILQFANWRRERPKITVEAQLQFGSLSDANRHEVRGTPREVVRDGVAMQEEMLIAFEVINRGGKAVQISAIVIEAIEASVST